MGEEGEVLANLTVIKFFTTLYQNAHARDPVDGLERSEDPHGADGGKVELLQRRAVLQRPVHHLETEAGLSEDILQTLVLTLR